MSKAEQEILELLMMIAAELGTHNIEDGSMSVTLKTETVH